MDDEYILEHLKKWVPLFYGKENAQYAFSKKKGDYFYFGYENGDDFVTNKVSKPVAIFLALGNTSFLKFLKKQGIDKDSLQPIKRRRRNE
jgi:hypothetical protein